MVAVPGATLFLFMQSTPMGRPRLLKFYVATVLVGAFASLGIAAWGQEWQSSNVFTNGVVAILAVGLAAELSSVSLHVGSSILSIAFIPFLAATFLFPAIWAMSVAGLTVLVVEALFRRKPWIKVAFNTSKEILAVGLASSVYHLLGGEPSVVQFRILAIPIVGAGIVYSAANSLTVSFAVSLSEGLDFGEAWVRVYGGSVLYDLFATPIPALLAYLYTRWQLGGVVALAVPLFVVRHMYSMNLQLVQANRDLLELMVKAIEARDPYTSGHSQRVSQYARILAKEAGLSGKQVEQITTAALLHDVGKIYEDYAPLLRKEGKLTPEERRVLQSHPARSAELVTTISKLQGPVADAVRYHHENFDGSGYPDGLSGENIPIGARVIMLADTLDAMTTDRPYRRALPFERVVDEVLKYSGSQFDPDLAQLLITSQTIRRLVASASLSGVQAPAPPTLDRAASIRAERAAV
ncbi:MAG: hypothetical protein DMD55_19245 [Gemmatimonadetes bacterium]|nr:MAG: hypothetical protein DMD55_19245 [Gemmatimonadota bacterium]